MIKVLFIAKYGHDLSYFKKIKNHIDFYNSTDIKADLIFNVPLFLFEFFYFFRSLDLSKKEIEEVLLSEVKRKYIKYGETKAKFYSIWFVFLSRLYYIKYHRILSYDKYSAICIWGGYNMSQKIAILVAKKLGIKVFHFENGLLPNTAVMDPRGTNFYNSVPRNWEFYKNIESDFEPLNLVPRISEKSSQGVVDLSKPYIFCPFQVALDTQILIHSPWITSMEAFYAVIEKVADEIEDKDLIFVIKEHPSCNFTYHNLRNKDNPRIFFANSNKTEDLIRNSEMVITVNSTVGIEGMMYNKKVVTLGNAFYSGYGFAKHALNLDELLDIINAKDSWTVSEESNERYFSYLKNYYLIPGNWQNPDYNHLSSVASRLLNA